MNSQYPDFLKEELQAVESLLLETHPDVKTHPHVPPQVMAAIRRLIRNGGKRLRPALVLLSAHLCGAEVAPAISVAAAIEMLHTATLIHDDLIDQSRLRRNHPTLNAEWSAAATILTGDLAFAWASRLVAASRNPQMVAQMAATLETICGGELRQLFDGRGKIPTRAEYEQRIYAKTASLFVLATQAGAILAHRPAAELDALTRFGQHLGQAFQIADDVLDFMGQEAVLGKPVGSDLRQGLITLPVIHYAQAHPDDPHLRAVLDRTADEETLLALLADLRRSDAAAWAMAQAEAEVSAALDALVYFSDSPARQTMAAIAQRAIARRF